MNLSKQTLSHLEYILHQVADDFMAYDEINDHYCYFCGAEYGSNPSGPPVERPHVQVTIRNESLGANVTTDCPVVVAKDILERGVLNG